MDIHNSSERKVICTQNTDNHWSFEDNASQYLEVGKTYNVIDIEVHSWHTRVTVAEFPDRQFNSICFEEI